MNYVSSLERRQERPKLRTLEALANALGVALGQSLRSPQHALLRRKTVRQHSDSATHRSCPSPRPDDAHRPMLEVRDTRCSGAGGREYDELCLAEMRSTVDGDTMSVVTVRQRLHTR